MCGPRKKGKLKRKKDLPALPAHGVCLRATRTPHPLLLRPRSQDAISLVDQCSGSLGCAVTEGRWICPKGECVLSPLPGEEEQLLTSLGHSHSHVTKGCPVLSWGWYPCGTAAVTGVGGRWVKSWHSTIQHPPCLATPMACRSSRARDGIRATAVT